MPRNLSPSTTQSASAVYVHEVSSHVPWFDALPDCGFVREAQLVRSPKRPNDPAPWPISAPTYWRKIRAGTLPQPIKLSKRVSTQNVGEIRAVQKAWTSGATDDEMRALVMQLHAARTANANVSGAKS